MYYCVWFFISFVVYTSNLEAWNCCKLPKTFGWWMLNPTVYGQIWLLQSECLWSLCLLNKNSDVISITLQLFNDCLSDKSEWVFFFLGQDRTPFFIFGVVQFEPKTGIANGSWLISHSTYKFIPFFIDTIPCFENISVMNLEIWGIL